MSRCPRPLGLDALISHRWEVNEPPSREASGRSAAVAVSKIEAYVHDYYAKLMTEAKSDKAKIPAEVAELDARITRLRNRLKAGGEDMTPDDLMAIIEKVEAQKAALLAAQAEAKRNAKLLHALPAAAKQYREADQHWVERRPDGGWTRQGGSAAATSSLSD